MRKLNFIVLFAMMMLVIGCGGQKEKAVVEDIVATAPEMTNVVLENDYFKAVEQKMATETISKVLYPSDSFEAGKELRLIQEYFLAACSIRDITRRYLKENDSFDKFSDKVAIQLNDTHPALTVAELMRTMVDENDLEWDEAWEMTQATLGYTNHTLLPEERVVSPLYCF